MLKDLLNGYNRIGIRTTADDENYKVGDTCRKSYEWDYENDCSTFNTESPVKLNGTCVIELIVDELDENEIINRISKVANNYAGNQIILVGGYYAEYGSDENEIIIEDAKVIAIL